MVVRARRAVRRDDVFRLDRFIERADALPECGRAFNVAIGQTPCGQTVEKGGLVLAGQREQLVERHGIDTRLRDVVSRADLPFVHPFLYGERFDVHKMLLSACRRGIKQKAPGAFLIALARRTYGIARTPFDPHPVMRKAIYFVYN